MTVEEFAAIAATVEAVRAALADGALRFQDADGKAAPPHSGPAPAPV